MPNVIYAPPTLLFAARPLPAANAAVRTAQNPSQCSLRYFSMAANFSDWVRGRVDGTVKEHSAPSDLPLRRRVNLFRQRDGRIVGETWSDATTGAYSFYGVQQTEKYFVASFDHLLNYNAAIKSDITPDLVP